MSNIIKSLKFLRWNLKWIRYIGKFYRKLLNFKKSPYINQLKDIKSNGQSNGLFEDGWDRLLFSDTINFLDERHHHLKGDGKSFFDISSLYSSEVNACAIKVLSDPKVSNMISEYFYGEDPWLWNVSLNQSIPKKGLSDSQFWHFDYGDSKQLHLMFYVTKITEKSGPFTFMPKKISNKVRRNPFFIERLTDEDLIERHSIDPEEKIQATGEQGTLYIVDPGVLMHQGARCEEERTVLFITITTSTPYDLGGSSTLNRDSRNRLYNEYSATGQKNTDSLVFSKHFFH
tara:strand:- start:12601 stop:13461 length:861 start_codon:yes stop_codon:yes gene_type:complete